MRTRSEVLRQFAAYALAVLAVLAMVAVTICFATGQVTRALDDLAELAVALLASAAAALAAVKASGRLRAAWWAVAAGCLSWSIGEAIWSTYELVLHRTTPFPSWADVGFLGFPVGAVTALALFPTGASRSDKRRMVLDGLVAASAIGLISWLTALGAVVQAGGGSFLATSVSVAYPAGDVVVLVMCVLVLPRSRSHQGALAVMAAGLALMAVSDSGFAYLTAQGRYATGDPVDLGWILAFGLLALAPLTSRSARPQVADRDGAAAGAALPYLPLLAVVGVLAWHYSEGRTLTAGDAALLATLVVLISVRQFLTGRDNQLLARGLASRDAELRHQAFHDGLTGLANRALFVDRVEHALELHRRDQRPLAVCFLDLDGFKAVNDTLGHAAGDELLRQAGDRFRASLSAADTLARLGGDEFAVLLEDGPDPLQAAERLLQTLAAPFLVAGTQARVQASIGVARVGAGSPSPTLDDLLGRADLAMYVVKRRGKNGVLLYTDGLQLTDEDEQSLARALAQALLDGQVTVAFQPVTELASGRILSFECLARWAPQGKEVPPEQFVAVAERCQLIDQLFQAVLAQACAALVVWKRLPGFADLTVAVNVSPSQLTRADLPDQVAAELARHGLRGQDLVLEITETMSLDDPTVSLVVCQQLRGRGIRLSVDDFGAGMSSMARLRTLPIDEIKIDRSLITGVDKDERAQRFVRGVIAFAHQVGLTVTAEGIERAEERKALTALGCHLGQGFFFASPVSADEVGLLLARGAHLPHRGWPVPAPQQPGPRRIPVSRVTAPGGA